MASVRKRPWTHNGITKEKWVCEYTDRNGKRRLHTPKSGLKKDAEAFRIKIEGEMADGSHIAQSQTRTLGQAMDAWLEDCERRWRIKDKMSGATLKNYQNGAAKAPENLRNRLLTELTAVHVQDYINALAEVHPKRSVEHFTLPVRQTLTFAVRRKWLVRNPLAHDRVRIPEIANPEKRIPNRQEIKRLLDALSERRKHENPIVYQARVAMVALALFCGLRRGEIAGLQWSDVDFTRGVLNVRHSYSSIDRLKSTKTKAGRRMVPMAAPVRSVLESLLSSRKGGQEYVLVTSTGNPILPQKLTHFHFVPVMREAGLLTETGSPLFSLHSLRHAYVSLLIAQGLSAFHVSRLVGHASIRMTLDIYGHLFPEDEAGTNAVLAMASSFDLSTSSPALSGGMSQMVSLPARQGATIDA